jgi:hypothetical protein
MVEGQAMLSVVCTVLNEDEEAEVIFAPKKVGPRSFRQETCLICAGGPQALNQFR